MYIYIQDTCIFLYHWSRLNISLSNVPYYSQDHPGTWRCRQLNSSVCSVDRWSDWRLYFQKGEWHLLFHSLQNGSLCGRRESIFSVSKLLAKSQDKLRSWTLDGIHTKTVEKATTNPISQEIMAKAFQSVSYLIAYNWMVHGTLLYNFIPVLLTQIE